MDLIKKYTAVLPGFGLALVIAAAAKFLEGLLPVHLIGASVIALFLGMVINNFRRPGKKLAVGLKFTSKKILKFAIILLGASLNIRIVLEVGRLSLCVMVFTLFTCFGIGHFVGKALKTFGGVLNSSINWNLKMKRILYFLFA